jgi:hypothetical protein
MFLFLLLLLSLSLLILILMLLLYFFFPLFCDVLVLAAAVYVVVDAPAVICLLQFVNDIFINAVAAIVVVVVGL